MMFAFAVTMICWLILSSVTFKNLLRIAVRNLFCLRCLLQQRNKGGCLKGKSAHDTGGLLQSDVAVIEIIWLLFWLTKNDDFFAA